MLVENRLLLILFDRLMLSVFCVLICVVKLVVIVLSWVWVGLSVWLWNVSRLLSVLFDSDVLDRNWFGFCGFVLVMFCDMMVSLFGLDGDVMVVSW